jgi:N-acyl-D-aspartate/D-glutamate deacylase
VRSGGKALFTHAFLNQRPDAVEEMIANPTVVLGLADAGAHVGQIMDASQPTFFLRDWVRDRKLLSLEEAVRRLTSDTAELFGIQDRGVLRPGAFADLNVIDLDGLRLPAPEYVHDFPGGAGRFVQRGSGYDYTLVNGQVFMEFGQHSGGYAGRILRSA